MHIGIDFDNTIVSYDNLFHRVALEQGLIPPEVQKNKVAVRDHLRREGMEERWVEMQGYVYGARMQEAEVFPGFIDFVFRARNAGYQVSIVSHKTATPFAGPKYDLHAAARSWISSHLVSSGKHMFEDEHVFFEPTKAEKFSRIQALRCDTFIDDLPEILMADAMPQCARKILFDPESNHAADCEGVLLAASWDEIRSLFDV